MEGVEFHMHQVRSKPFKCYNLIDEINALQIYLNRVCSAINVRRLRSRTSRELLINLKIIDREKLLKTVVVMRMKILNFHHSRTYASRALLRSSFASFITVT